MCAILMKVTQLAALIALNMNEYHISAAIRVTCADS